jgi:hypothetical protein
MQADFPMSDGKDMRSVEKYDGKILMSPRSMEMLESDEVSINEKGEIKYTQTTYSLSREN